MDGQYAIRRLDAAMELALATIENAPHLTESTVEWFDAYMLGIAHGSEQVEPTRRYNQHRLKLESICAEFRADQYIKRCKALAEARQ